MWDGVDDSLKKYVVLCSLYAIDTEIDFKMDDDMWQLYYSLSKEEIEDIIETLKKEGLIRIKSSKNDNLIYPALVLTNRGIELVEEHINKFSRDYKFNINKLSDILTSIIGFLNAYQRYRYTDITLHRLIADLDMELYKKQNIIFYLSKYGNISILYSDRQYLDAFYRETIGYLRDFLGKLPELEATIFRYSYNIHDIFYRDILEIMDYYQLDDRDVISYHQTTLKRYQSLEWYDGCIWIKQIVDCFFKSSLNVMSQLKGYGIN